ncbi:MAG: WecB/TagA/CpsF family glycosyltransferase [Candidatus Baltobacteraceae bacterium]
MTLRILGCKLDALDADAATQAVLGFAKAQRGAQIVTLGTEMVVYAQRDVRYRELINASALSLCDTAGLLAVARARGAPLRERVTGVDLIEHFCATAARDGVSVYLLGGSPGIAQQAASQLQRRYPGLLVAGARDGYFPESASAQVAAEVRASGAHVLFAGLGFPKQEFWLAQWLPQTHCGAGIGVGGSFDVISGKLERAPQLWRRMHLEWLYRLLREPKRWRRQLALPYFVLLAGNEQVRILLGRGKA